MLAESTPVVAVVARDPLALAGLVHLLSQVTSLRLGRLARTVDDLGNDPHTGPAPEVVVLFDRMPGNRAFQSISRLRDRGPVLLVCAFDAMPCPVTAIQAGASGVIAAGGAVELGRAVRSVATGGIYVGTGLAGAFRDRITGVTTAAVPPPGQPPALAPREVETLRWIADGYTHAQAARRMRVAPGTVNTYAKRLRLKLDARNKAELTRRAVELGYVNLAETRLRTGV